MDSARLVHRSHPIISQEWARDARAEAWRYALACLAENRLTKKEATRPGGPDDRTKVQGDSADVPIIQD